MSSARKSRSCCSEMAQPPAKSCSAHYHRKRWRRGEHAARIVRDHRSNERNVTGVFEEREQLETRRRATIPKQRGLFGAVFPKCPALIEARREILRKLISSLPNPIRFSETLEVCRR